MRAIWLMVVSVLGLLFSMPVPVQAAVPAEYQRVQQILGWTGDYQDNVFMIELPRTDIGFTLRGTAVPPAFGLTGSISMTRGQRGMNVLMGEWVLLQQEVNPILSRLLQQNFQVTAIHNHFFWDTPRVIFLHMQGMGTAVDLANRVKPVLAMIGTIPPETGLPDERLSAPRPPVTIPLTLDTTQLDRIVGDKGEKQPGGVYQYSLERKDIRLMMNGARITERMGLHIESQFVGSNERATMTTEMALLPAEVNPVQKVFRTYGIPVTAVHNHMIGTNPEIIFVHVLASGSATQLANALRAAIAKTGARRR